MLTSRNRSWGTSALAIAVFSLCACNSGTYEGHGLTWKLPRGVHFEAEAPPAGANATLSFSGGVKVRVYEFSEHADFPREAADTHLEDIRTRVMPGAVRPISSRTGSLPAGKVARFVWTEGGNRTLAYYLPGPSFVVVLSLTAPESSFSGLEDHFDMSLGSVKLSSR